MNLTSQLLAGRSSRLRASTTELLKIVTERLVASYGTPTLGNFRDPIKEIFFILLSARTNDTLYRRAHTKLFQRFPGLNELACANRREIRNCVRGAGLGDKRTEHILKIAKRLAADLGKNPRRALRAMDARQAFDYLTSLPGFGPKSAFCVMMCSLDFDVFPVDINVQRVFERMGVIPARLKHYQAQSIAPRHVPEGSAKRLHVGLVEHGRRICLPGRPKCEKCVLVDICRYGKSGLRSRSIQSVQ